MKAPALEKGLDILECLVAGGGAMTLSQIARHCGRSVSEIQRMIHVLERRGYLDRTETNAYLPGLKLYEMGRFRHPFRQLQTVAEPIMAALAEGLGQSIHLSVEDRGQMLILSETLGSGVASVALKVGSRHPLEKTLSGRILLLNYPGKGRNGDRRQLRKEGYLAAASQLFSGVQDVGVPLRADSEAPVLAVLACSCLKPKGQSGVPTGLVENLLEAARVIQSERIPRCW